MNNFKIHIHLKLQQIIRLAEKGYFSKDLLIKNVGGYEYYYGDGCKIRKFFHLSFTIE